MKLSYQVVDVFTQSALEGNPLAVFTDATDLDAQTMQRIAAELNLSETSFILPATRPDCAARVRIFTPAAEMRFAGHPTIGTAYVLRAIGAVSPEQRSFALEENVGPVPVRIEGGDDPMIWLQTPPIARGRTVDPAAAAALAGLQPEDVIARVTPAVYDAGNPNLYIAVRDREAVDRAWVEHGAQQRMFADEDPVCVFVFAPVESGAYSRMFAPELGVKEDPATGSATGPLAAFMMDNGLCGTADGTRFVSEQGTKMGRRSLLHVLIRGENGSVGIDVGGHVRPLVTATMSL